MASDDKSLADKIAAYFKDVQNILQFIPAITGTGVLIYESLAKNPVIFYIGLCFIFISIIWIIYQNFIKTKKPKSPIVSKNETGSSSAYIRGLKPFERGDKLFGRDLEQKQINSILRAKEFRFGYISGEAGSGKTSFIRSVLLDEIEKSGKFPLYVSGIKGDPLKTITKLIAKEIDTPLVSDILKDNIILLNKKLNKTVVLIIDQFEEFFIAIKSIETRKNIIQKLVEITNDENFNNCIVVSLRKEFVDDLQEFGPEIEQPTNAKYCLRLKNWDVELAKIVFQNIVDADNIRFSQELCFELINDLAVQGYVRPVELQIVTGFLINKSIHNLKGYESKNRANGILGDYIRDLIKPPDNNGSEFEILLARVMLRLFCDEKNDTKRAVGLTQDELINLSKNTLKNFGKENLIDNEEGFIKSFTSLLKRFMDEFIIQFEDDEKINLVHDYIVGPIRYATSDIETSEEKANRLLSKYLEDQKTERSTSIPRKQYKYILRNASINLKDNPNAKRLLGRSHRKIIFNNSLPFIIAIAILTALFPPGYKNIKISPAYSADFENWRTSSNGKILVSKFKDSLLIWQNGSHLKLINQFPHVAYSTISKNARWLFFSDSTDSYVLKNISDSFFIKKAQLKVIPFVNNNYVFGFEPEQANFSPNEGFFYLPSAKGDFYLINLFLNKPIISKTNILFDSSFKYNHLMNEDIREYTFSPNNKYLISYSSAIYLHNIKRLIIIPTNDLEKFYIDSTNYNYSFIFSSNDSLMVIGNDKNLYLLKSADLFNNFNIDNKSPLIADSSFLGTYYSKGFSPNDNWLFFGGKYPLGYKSYFINIKTPLKDTISIDFKISILSNITKPYYLLEDSTNKWFIADSLEGMLYNSKMQSLFNPLSLKYLSNFKLSPNSKFMIAESSGDALYAWDIKTIDKTIVKLLHINPDDHVSHTLAKTDNFIYVIDNNSLHFGDIHNALEELSGISNESEIQKIALNAERTKLIIMTKKELFEVERKYYLWNIIPIKTYVWPEMAENEVIDNL